MKKDHEIANQGGSKEFPQMHLQEIEAKPSPSLQNSNDSAG